jgi:glycerol-3-phosphate dehydrogenase
MRRDFDALKQEFDVLVLGAGVYGAAIARLAAMQGMKVALVERGDFGGATSRNSAKLLHGGLRYVQHLDLPRIRESVAAQRAWRCAAPHLTRPLRCLIPTYGFGTRGPLALAGGILAYELVASNRNRGVPPRLKLPHGGVMSRRALLQTYPMLERADVTGGAYWYDAQMLDATRLTFECISDAHRAGAVVVNHAEAVSLLVASNTVSGAVVRDGLSGKEIEVKARLTVNATGPWVNEVLAALSMPNAQKVPLAAVARNVNIVTRRVLNGEDGIGVGSRQASDAAVGKSNRLFFITPWQDCSIIGTWHDAFRGNPDTVHISRSEVQSYLEEVNEALPYAGLRLEDVRSVHVGVTPGTEDESSRAKRPSFVIHEGAEGLEGLCSIAGIKYTTAPTEARKLVYFLSTRLASRWKPERDFSSLLPGATGYGDDSEAEALSSSTRRTEPEVAWASRVYGSERAVLFAEIPQNGLADSEHVFRCRVLRGVRHEMVVTLGDAIFRATDHAERGVLTAAQLEWCADTLAKILQWTHGRRASELADVRVRLAQAQCASSATLQSDFEEQTPNAIGRPA